MLFEIIIIIFHFMQNTVHAVGLSKMCLQPVFHGSSLIHCFLKSCGGEGKDSFVASARRMLAMLIVSIPV